MRPPKIWLGLCWFACLAFSGLGLSSHEGPSLAIVIPFTPLNMQQVVGSLKHWESFAPCSSASLPPGPVTLYFQYSGDLSAPPTPNYPYDGAMIHRTVQALWTNLAPEAKRCFQGGMRFLTANVTLSDIRPDITCPMFYVLFDELEATGHDYFFLMGVDVAPIRQDWLVRLFDELPARSSKRCPFWQKGSIERCSVNPSDNSHSHDLSIDGHALYCLQDGQFTKFRQRLLHYYPPRESIYSGCSTSLPPYRTGFDKMMYQYRVDPDNYAYSQAVFSKFIYSSFIQSLCDEPFDTPSLLSEDPDTLFVRSVWAFYSHELQIVYRVFHRVYHRSPSPEEQRKFVTRLAHQEYSECDLMTLLCNTDQASSPKALRECLPFRSDPHRHGKRSYIGGTEHVTQPSCLETFCRVVFNQSSSSHSGNNGGGGVLPGPPSPPVYVNISSNTTQLSEPLLYMSPSFTQSLVSKLSSPPSSPSSSPSSQCATLSVSNMDQTFPQRYQGKYYLWNTDLHPTPMVCNGKLFAELGVVTHTEVDFFHCSWFGVCRERLKVLRFDDWRGFSLDPCPNKLRRDFFEAYKADPEMARVDLFICSHPVANCELYMPFNRSIILYPTTRLEFGRNDDNIAWRERFMDKKHNPIRWRQWLSNVHAIASNPRNVLAANNIYDALYTTYFTGLPVAYLPSWCGDASETYVPSRPEILIGPSRDNLDDRCKSWNCQPWEHPMMQALTTAMTSHRQRSGHDYRIVRTRDMYPQFSYEQISQHPAMIIFPYQISVMTIFEVYRLNIPLFVPSQKLLLEWHTNYNFVWERVYGHPERPKHFPPPSEAFSSSSSSSLPPIRPMPFIIRGRDASDLTQDDEDTLAKMLHKVQTQPPQYDLHTMPNPNSDKAEDFAWWVQFHDYYLWPHIQYFDSWEQLLHLLDSVDLMAVSGKMQQYNHDLRQDLLERWREVFARTFQNDLPGSRVVPQDYDQAMRQLYHGKADAVRDPDPYMCHQPAFLVYSHKIVVDFLLPVMLVMLAIALLWHHRYTLLSWWRALVSLTRSRLPRTRSSSSFWPKSTFID